MRFLVKASSDIKPGDVVNKYRFLKDYKLNDKYTDPSIEIKSLEDMLELIDKIGYGVIVYRGECTNKPRIEIYDDYRE